MKRVFILGAGVTGLAAGLSSGLEVFEAAEAPGGICSSYYLKKGEIQRRPVPPPDDEAYRFEIGGGHWLFGCDPILENFLSEFCSLKKYRRESSVYFPDQKKIVPFPIQKHTRFLNREVSRQIRKERQFANQASGSTLKEWLQKTFGATLCRLFFFPFHERYTAGLYSKIMPQDEYKSPARSGKGQTGYNPEYFYPEKGLGNLCHRLAGKCRIEYGKCVVRIDVSKKKIYFQSGVPVSYDALISTLPLNRMIELTQLKVGVKSDPFTSVLVLNIGATPGPSCPEDHWVYVPESRSGFYRVGFYSNVDTFFLPRSARKRKTRVSLYVERAFANGEKPSEKKVQEYARSVVSELKTWQWINEVEVLDPTWIDVAYSWSYPGSEWKSQAISKLESHDIYPLGRYGRWHFQGIADSIRDGLWAGGAFKFFGKQGAACPR